MNFRENARRKLKTEQEKRRKQEEEKEKSLIRSADDWKMISEYIGQVVLEKIEKYGRNPVSISVDSEEMIAPRFANKQPIYLSNGERLKVTQKDIKRFCKENRFRLTYMDKKYFTTRSYQEFYVIAYLIKV